MVLLHKQTYMLGYIQTFWKHYYTSRLTFNITTISYDHLACNSLLIFKLKNHTLTFSLFTLIFLIMYSWFKKTYTVHIDLQTHVCVQQLNKQYQRYWQYFEIKSVQSWHYKAVKMQFQSYQLCTVIPLQLVVKISEF